MPQVNNLWLCGDCRKQQRSTLVILVGGGGESIARPITMSSSTVYLEVQYIRGSLEFEEWLKERQVTVGHQTQYIIGFSLKFQYFAYTGLPDNDKDDSLEK